MKTTVLYFSPTGGTERVAQLIAGELKAQALDITVFDYDLSYGEDEVIFFCFPVYGGRIPKPMYKRMQGIRGARTPAVLVAVYGNRAVEDALMEMSDLAREKGFRTVGGAEMIAPHSIDRRFGAGRRTRATPQSSWTFSISLRRRRPSASSPCPAATITASMTVCRSAPSPARIAAAAARARRSAPRARSTGRPHEARPRQVHLVHALCQRLPV